MSKKGDRIVRKTFGDGRWFPEKREVLNAMVTGYIEDARVGDPGGRIVGVIAPHAGYPYSGKVMRFVPSVKMPGPAINQTRSSSSG